MVSWLTKEDSIAFDRRNLRYLNDEPVFNVKWQYKTPQGDNPLKTGYFPRKLGKPYKLSDGDSIELLIGLKWTLFYVIVRRGARVKLVRTYDEFKSSLTPRRRSGRSRKVPVARPMKARQSLLVHLL